MNTDTADTNILAMTDRLAAWLRARHPEARHIRFPTVEPPAQGYSNETSMLDFLWERHGVEERRPLVLRLQPTGVGLFAEYDLSIQYRCMERLPGRVVRENPLYHLEGWLYGLPPEGQRAVWIAGVEAVAKVSRLDWQTLGFDFLNRRGAGQTHIDEQPAGQRRFLGWVEAQAGPYPHLRRALEWLDSNRPSAEAVGLCWGDSKIGNMLFEGERCTGLID